MGRREVGKESRKGREYVLRERRGRREGGGREEGREVVREGEKEERGKGERQVSKL